MRIDHKHTLKGIIWNEKCGQIAHHHDQIPPAWQKKNDEHKLPKIKYKKYAKKKEKKNRETPLRLHKNQTQQQ